MYFLRARYYNQETGKFISRDPIGQNDQVNLYTYVANSPLKYVDRMGREKVLIIRGMEDLNVKDINDGVLHRTERLERSILLRAGIKDNQIKTKEIRNTDELEAIFSDIKTRNLKYQKITIIAHGTESTITFGEGKNGVLTLNKLKNLHVSEEFNTPILLESCNTGRGEMSIGELLAKQLGTKVIAPNNFLNVSKDGLEKNVGGAYKDGLDKSGYYEWIKAGLSSGNNPIFGQGEYNLFNF